MNMSNWYVTFICSHYFTLKNGGHLEFFSSYIIKFYRKYKYEIELSRKHRFSRLNCCFIYKNKVFIAFFVIFTGKMAAILDFFNFFQIFKYQLFNIRLYDIVAKYELSNSISEVIGAKKNDFSLKILRNGKEKSEKAP